jgi:hypothetical protein
MFESGAKHHEPIKSNAHDSEQPWSGTLKPKI